MGGSDPYYGRSDISLYCEQTLNDLFPSFACVSSQLANSADGKAHFIPGVGIRAPNLGHWTGYLLYRTMLPSAFIYHSLHLVRRLALDFDPDPSAMDPWTVSHCPSLFQHRLFLSALILVTKYHQDDAYSNKSWSIASRHIWTVPEIDNMELSMLGALEWRLRCDGETVSQIIEEEEWVYGNWLKVEQQRLKDVSASVTSRRKRKQVGADQSPVQKKQEEQAIMMAMRKEVEKQRKEEAETQFKMQMEKDLEINKTQGALAFDQDIAKNLAVSFGSSIDFPLAHLSSESRPQSAQIAQPQPRRQRRSSVTFVDGSVPDSTYLQPASIPPPGSVTMRSASIPNSRPPSRIGMADRSPAPSAAKKVRNTPSSYFSALKKVGSNGSSGNAAVMGGARKRQSSISLSAAASHLPQVIASSLSNHSLWGCVSG